MRSLRHFAFNNKQRFWFEVFSICPFICYSLSCLLLLSALPFLHKSALFFIILFSYICSYLTTLFSAVNNYLFTLCYPKLFFFNYQAWINQHFYTHFIKSTLRTVYFLSAIITDSCKFMSLIWRDGTNIPAPIYGIIVLHMNVQMYLSHPTTNFWNSFKLRHISKHNPLLLPVKEPTTRKCSKLLFKIQVNS